MDRLGLWLSEGELVLDWLALWLVLLDEDLLLVSLLDALVVGVPLLEVDLLRDSVLEPLTDWLPLLETLWELLLLLLSVEDTLWVRVTDAVAVTSVIFRIMFALFGVM